MNEDKVKVYFTAQEINALNGLLDLALKAGGRQVVSAFAMIDDKLREAVERQVEIEKDRKTDEE